MEDEKAFAVHMANSHTDASKSYLCPTCGKGFQKSSHFYTHIKCHAPAADRAKFKCNVCEKNCSTKANLASHMRIHDGIREFTCDQCGRSFVQKGNLHAHILTHVQAKPFGCSICDKAWVIHHPNVCGSIWSILIGGWFVYCRFKTAARLATHRKVHSDYRPHKCKVCNRDFREKTTLNEHMRIHTGVMPYECEYCGKRFRFKGVLAVSQRYKQSKRDHAMDLNIEFDFRHIVEHTPAKDRIRVSNVIIISLIGPTTTSTWYVGMALIPAKRCANRNRYRRRACQPMQNSTMWYRRQTQRIRRRRTPRLQRARRCSMWSMAKQRLWVNSNGKIN